MLVERIKELAKERNTNIAEIERIVGFGKSTINKWNASSPSAEKLLKVANFLSVYIEYLLTGKEPKYKSLDISSLTSYEIDIIMKFRSGNKPIFNDNLLNDTNIIGALDSREMNMILKFRELPEEDKQDAYEIINLKYERGLRKGIGETTKSYPLKNGNGNMVG